jgi:hypothetical protein
MLDWTSPSRIESLTAARGARRPGPGRYRRPPLWVRTGVLILALAMLTLIVLAVTTTRLNGTLQATVTASGGPQAAPPVYPLPGPVQITGFGAHGSVQGKVQVGDSGRFSVELPPGRYTLTFWPPGCASTVIVVPVKPTRAAIHCSVA